MLSRSKTTSWCSRRFTSPSQPSSTRNKLSIWIEQISSETSWWLELQEPICMLPLEESSSGIRTTAHGIVRKEDMAAGKGALHPLTSVKSPLLSQYPNIKVGGVGKSSFHWFKFLRVLVKDLRKLKELNLRIMVVGRIRGKISSRWTSKLTGWAEGMHSSLKTMSQLISVARHLWALPVVLEPTSPRPRVRLSSEVTSTTQEKRLKRSVKWSN